MEALRLEAGALGSLSGGSTPLKALLPGAEGFVLPPGDPELCREHGEKFTLFCVDDLEPVCSQCGLTETHEGHRVYPITEAVPDCKVCWTEKEGLWLNIVVKEEEEEEDVTVKGDTEAFRVKEGDVVFGVKEQGEVTVTLENEEDKTGDLMNAGIFLKLHCWLRACRREARLSL
eukprot:XP_014039524.1 PREDICTED: E3 ubiquitin-protein ligase TRIM22-like [Salmo salar]